MSYINSVHRLIESYVHKASLLCEKLKGTLLTNENLLRARRLKLIPQQGKVDDIHYSFHGVGCYFEYKNGSIEIDFGPDGNCNGFDQYRLFKYLENMNEKEKSAYEDILEKEIFVQQFSELLSLGIIENPRLEPSPHLYFLAAQLHSQV